MQRTTKTTRTKKSFLGALALLAGFLVTGCELPHQTAGNLFQAKIQADAQKDRVRRETRTQVTLAALESQTELDRLEAEQNHERELLERQQDFERDRWAREDQLEEDRFERGGPPVGDAEAQEDGLELYEDSNGNKTAWWAGP